MYVCVCVCTIMCHTCTYIYMIQVIVVLVIFLLSTIWSLWMAVSEQRLIESLLVVETIYEVFTEDWQHRTEWVPYHKI